MELSYLMLAVITAYLIGLAIIFALGYSEVQRIERRSALVNEHAAMNYESIEDYRFWHWTYDHFGS